MSIQSKLDLSIVIPVYRSSATLQPLWSRLRSVLEETGLHYEVIFVDDGSPDDSWLVIQELQRQCPENIVGVQLMRNFGQHNALMCGFRNSRGQYIITMDDDLQNPPEEIPKLLNAIHVSGLDLIYGCFRFKEHNRWRNFGSSLANSFFRFIFKSPARVTSFRIIRRSLMESILSYNLNFTFIDGLLAWNTQRIGTVPVEHHPRHDGRSGYSLSKLATLSFNLFTNFSLLPLQLVSVLGIVSATSGIVLAAYYLLRYFLGRILVLGYASIVIAVLVLGGIQLLSLGIIGEYLGRLHLNVNRKPQYQVREFLASGALADPSMEAADTSDSARAARH